MLFQLPASRQFGSSPLVNASAFIVWSEQTIIVPFQLGRWGRYIGSVSGRFTGASSRFMFQKHV